VRHVEIAGAGIAGLAAAVSFAQRGWSVRVHERYPSLRAEGFGISILENGLSVLETLGVLEDATQGGTRTRRRVNRSGDGTVLSTSARAGRAYRLARHQLVAALAAEAERKGAEIRFNSVCVGARPNGQLQLEGGQQLEADLVIAADGIASPVRESLGIPTRKNLQTSGAARFLIPRHVGDFTPEQAEETPEYWSGSRRIIIGPCSDTEIYLALCCRSDDRRGRAVPIDASTWRASFPILGKYIERTRHVDWSYVRWMPFQTVTMRSWSRGRVAVIGDASHAMPPNLAQGGGCALMNALGLAHAVDRANDVLEGLAEWEKNEKPVIQKTQRWSVIYGWLARMPRVWRDPALWLLNNNSWLRQSYQAAALYRPTGSDEHRALRSATPTMASLRR
jgi:2-polyprenyl-6-methoxyphenol hydroxylase-like FAD-dependent oxidoreductase